MKTVTNILSSSVVAAALAFSLTACESTPMSARIPATATQVAAANGTTTYRTSDAGMLYIYDKTWNKVVYSGEVKADQTVQVDTDHNSVLIDNRPVVEQASLGSGDKYQFYLDTKNASTTTVERRTVIERETHE